MGNGPSPYRHPILQSVNRSRPGGVFSVIRRGQAQSSHRFFWTEQPNGTAQALSPLFSDAHICARRSVRGGYSV